MRAGVQMACRPAAEHALLCAVSVLKSGLVLLQALCDLKYLKVKSAPGNCDGQ